MKRLAALLAASLLLAGCTAAGSGGMRASRPTAARKAAAVPVWPQTQNLFVGAGFIPPGALRRRRVPGTISGLRAGPAARLASETRLRAQCKHRPLQRFVITQGRGFPGWPRHSPSSVGADSISARGCLRRRGVRRDEGIPPYGRPEGGGRPCLALNAKFIRRGGIYPARGVCAAAGRADMESAPTGVCVAAGFPGGSPARGPGLRAQCKHRPLQGPAPQKQNTTNVPPCRISIAAARPRTASKL